MDGNLTSKPVQLGGAGARKIEIRDLNHDGKPDIVALFCQGNERISVFYNKGNGQFDDEKILLKLSPVMGSSYFELHDLNNNGELDLLVSNGDNWDYSSVPKPYHGFRIYENKGNGVFSQEKGSLKFQSVISNTLSKGINSLNSTLLKIQSVFSKSPHTFLIFPFITC